MALPVPFPTGELIVQKTNIGYMRNLWIPSSFDYKVITEDFWGDELNGKYPAAKTNGTSAAVTFTEHNEDGYLELVSGTSDDGYAGQGVGLQWTGDRGVLAEFIVKTPADVSGFKMEVGLADADDLAGMVNVKATPSGTGTDFAVVIVDTHDDDQVAFISSNGGSLVATQDIETVAASTFYRIAVRAEGNTVAAWINGVRVSGGTHAIEGGTKLTPWVFCQARSVSDSRTVQWHRWRVTYPAWE